MKLELDANKLIRELVTAEIQQRIDEILLLEEWLRNNVKNS